MVVGVLGGGGGDLFFCLSCVSCGNLANTPKNLLIAPGEPDKWGTSDGGPEGGSRKL